MPIRTLYNSQPPRRRQLQSSQEAIQAEPVTISETAGLDSPLDLAQTVLVTPENSILSSPSFPGSADEASLTDLSQALHSSAKTGDIHETTQQLKILVSNLATSGVKAAADQDKLTAQLERVIDSRDKRNVSNSQRNARKLNIILIGLVSLLVFNSLYAWFGYRPDLIANQQTTLPITERVGALPEVKTSAAKPGLKEVTEFAGNNAIADIGASVNLQNNFISNQDTPNCRTPIVPPVENGCGFALIPQAAGIPTKGVIYRSLTIETNLAEGDQIQIDTKNYERGTLTKDIGKLSGSNFEESITLPENIPLTDAIYIRIWAKQTEIKITKISLSYFHIDNLQAVKGLIQDDDLEKLQDGVVYRDVDENGKFNPDVETKWSCRSNFPGVKPVNIDKEGKFNLQRDDSCFTDIKPDSWYTDSKNLALLPGKWLLVFNLKEGREVYNFELLPTSEQGQLILTSQK